MGISSIVGFALSSNISARKMAATSQAISHALEPYKHLNQQSLIIGNTQLDIWGHGNLNDLICALPDGSVLISIGSPAGKTTIRDASNILLKDEAKFQLPWDGRTILLKISQAGNRWIMWNDWVGSIPVFYSEIDHGRLASTLEPIVVSAAGYTPDDFFLPGLVSLLINGHPLDNWTIYKNMKVIPADSMTMWDEQGVHTKKLWTIIPNQERWETGWDDLVDEMYELSKQAILDVLSTQPKWNIPLSSGLDSRLIAGVAAKAGVNATAYAWGGKNTTDVNYSRQIAKTLGFQWKHIELQKDFLKEYTPRWLSMFGSALNVHGMYQMCFLDALKMQSDVPITSGFIGDTLSGDAILDMMEARASKNPQLETEWYSNWIVGTLKPAAKFPLPDALEANAENLLEQIDSYPGARFQKYNYLEMWNRQRFFTSFSSTLLDYWNGVATPYLNREYARFSFSLPRVALDNRRLLGDVFRRYYGSLAIIPGTYAKDPFIITGKYLLLRRASKILPLSLHRGPLRGFGNVQLRMDIESVQATGKAALWPLFENLSRLADWIDIDSIEKDYQTIMKSKDDIRPLRRLQSLQTLVYRVAYAPGVA